ncbi:MAG TPA: TnsD family Tn7-like transposition protein [Verrucomicrobiae bacterium]|jgi:hypothetical protein|nr:TnsD family Tn7-like transposition protein [Verrucomicrobiae bacterium]
MFPDPYPGELLFSVLARFNERMAYPAEYASNLELFGVRHGTPAIELPNRIDRLVSKLPPGAIYTSDSIIQNNTLFPLYAPFLPDRNRDLVLTNMKGDDMRTTLLRSGIIAGRVRPPVYFSTCPVCDEQNVAVHGETYWDRRHQISGVQVCSVHSIFLTDTNVRLRWSLRKNPLTSAESAERAASVRRIDPNNVHDRMRLQIAESAAWLLDLNTSRPGLVAINRGYREILAQNDLLSPKGGIRLKRLYERFSACCPPDLLDRFGCELRDGGDGGWLGRLLREEEQGVAPLRHLLLLAILNVSAQDFFTSVIHSLGTALQHNAWPCLNPLCPDFQKPAVLKFEIKRAKHGFARIFECPKCGHRSSRTADGQKVIRVVQFGILWEQRLRSMWEDASLSLRALAGDLHADARSVLKYAVRSGLQFPRRGPTRLAKSPGYLRDLGRLPQSDSRDNKREAWSGLRGTHKSAGISELRRKAPALYIWLYRHDRKWMIEHSPACRRRVPKNNRVDWGNRDAMLVEHVIAVANRIKNQPGRPRRVTVRSIGIEMGIPVVLKTRRMKLPRTKAALAENVESTEQFVLRRIDWTLNSLKRQGSGANRSEIVRIAGIGTKALGMPSVQQAIARVKADLGGRSGESLPRLTNLVAQQQMATGPSKPQPQKEAKDKLKLNARRIPLERVDGAEF